MYNRKEFKREAKQLMRASTPHFMLVALVYVLLTTGLEYVVSWLTGGSGPLAETLSIFLNILVALFAMVMGVGFANYALRLSRREPTGMNSLFTAFSYSGRAIGVRLLVTVFVVLWGLLIFLAFAFVTGILAVFTPSIPLLFVAVMVLYVAAMVLFIFIALRYAMATFALADDPACGVMEAIHRSARIMRGNRGKFFVLELSFIGWGLLTALIALVVMGVGLWYIGTDWIIRGLTDIWRQMEAAYDPTSTAMGYYLLMEVADRLKIWGLLADVLSLPLTLWLIVYQQTAFARFYNYAGGYDYHQYMNGQPVPPVQEPQQPAAPLTDDRRAPAPEEPKAPDAPGQEESPRKPADQNDFYTSVLPPEPPVESDGSDEEEEI